MLHDTFVKHQFIIVVGGPNGVGKSTFTPALISHLGGRVDIIDTDAIAAALRASGTLHADVAAGRITLELIAQLIDQRKSFVIESTLSGVTLSKSMQRSLEAGYHISSPFLYAWSIEVLRQRIQQRVLQGGHYIMERDLQRRYQRSLRNFLELYAPLSHEWTVYDATGIIPVPISRGGRGTSSE